jgi:hypothetical protein
MSDIIATNKGGAGGFEPVPEGTYLATCYAIFDIGTRWYTNERTGADDENHQIVISWELPHETFDKEGEDGKVVTLPKAVSKRYRLSTNPKANLRKALDSWRGKKMTEEEAMAFKLSAVLGKSCQITIGHKEFKGRDGTMRKTEEIINISSLMKGTEVPPQVNKSRMYSITDITDNGGVFPDDMPEWVQNTIRESDEYKAFLGEGAAGPDPKARTSPQPPIDDDEVPF